jgi:hypothetical protein
MRGDMTADVAPPPPSPSPLKPPRFVHILIHSEDSADSKAVVAFLTKHGAPVLVLDYATECLQARLMSDTDSSRFHPPTIVSIDNMTQQRMLYRGGHLDEWLKQYVRYSDGRQRMENMQNAEANIQLVHNPPPPPPPHHPRYIPPSIEDGERPSYSDDDEHNDPPSSTQPPPHHRGGGGERVMPPAMKKRISVQTVMASSTREDRERHMDPRTGQQSTVTVASGQRQHPRRPPATDRVLEKSTDRANQSSNIPSTPMGVAAGAIFSGFSQDGTRTG